MVAAAGLARQSLACIVAPDTLMASAPLRDTALELAVPLRFVDGDEALLPVAWREPGNGVALGVAPAPVQPQLIGRPRGRLAVIGLGPGAAELMVPAVKAELARANDEIGRAHV